MKENSFDTTVVVSVFICAYILLQLWEKQEATTTSYPSNPQKETKNKTGQAQVCK